MRLGLHRSAAHGPRGGPRGLEASRSAAADNDTVRTREAIENRYLRSIWPEGHRDERLSGPAAPTSVTGPFASSIPGPIQDAAAPTSADSAASLRRFPAQGAARRALGQSAT